MHDSGRVAVDRLFADLLEFLPQNGLAGAFSAEHEPLLPLEQWIKHAHIKVAVRY